MHRYIALPDPQVKGQIRIVKAVGVQTELGFRVLGSSLGLTSSVQLEKGFTDMVQTSG